MVSSVPTEGVDRRVTQPIASLPAMKHVLSHLLAALLFLLSLSPARAQTITIPQPDNGLEGFELTDNGLYTWRSGYPGGGGELGGAPYTGMVNLMSQRPNRPVGPGTDTITLGQGTDLASRTGQTLLLDNYWFYYRWVGGSRRLYRHPMVNLFQPNANIDFGGQAYTSAGPVAAWNSNVVWAAEVGGVPKLFVKGVNSSAIQESNLPAGTNLQGIHTDVSLPAKLAVIKVVTPDGSGFTWRLILLTASGQIFTGNPAFGAVGMTLLATNCTDFAWRTEEWQTGDTPAGPIYERRTRLYVSTGRPTTALPGHVSRFDLTNNDSVVNESVTAPNQRLTSIAVDNDNIFVTRTAINPGVGIFGPTYNYADSSILRKIEPATPNGNFSGYVDWTVGQQGRNLRSDGPFVYWLHNGQLRRRDSGGAPERIDCSALEVECVQAVQDMNNTVPLVAGRSILVRGYAYYPQNNTGKRLSPSARLRVLKNGNLIGQLYAPSGTIVDAVRAPETLRATLNRSFNFDVPGAWTQQAGTGLLQFEFTVNPTLSTPENGAPETGNQPLLNNTTFVYANIVAARSPTLMFKQVRGTMTYSPFSGLNSGVPSPDFLAQISRAKSLLPVTDFHVRFSPGLLQRRETPPSGSPFNTFYDLDGSKHQAQAFTDLAAVESASSDPENETVWIGMIHPSEPWNWAGFATGGLVLNKMISGDRFPAWTSSVGGGILAHELGHTYGRGHVNQDVGAAGVNCPGGTPAAAYDVPPWDPCTIGPDWPDRSAVAGYDPMTPRGTNGTAPIIRPTMAGDLMSYHSSFWTSAWTWNALVNSIPVPPNRRPRGGNGTVSHPAVLRLIGSLPDSLTHADSFRVRSLPPDSVDGRKVQEMLAKSAASGSVSPLQALVSVGNPPILAGQYAVAEDEGGESGRGRFFLQDIPVPVGGDVTRVQLRRDGRIIAQADASPNAPTVQLAAPQFNAAAGVLLAEWSASDADGDPLEFTVQFSCDDGAHWQTLGEGVTDLGVAVSTQFLPGGTACRLRVIACDGFHTAFSASEAFPIAKRPPSIAIQGLRDDEPVPYGTRLALTASGYDAEDGSPAPESYNWSLVGPVLLTATGPDCILTRLAPGAYTLTLTGTDEENNSGTATRNFRVLPPSVPDSAVAPVLDGLCADAAYSASPVMHLDPVTAEPEVRLVHSGGALYLCASGIPSSGQSLFPRRLYLYLNPDGGPGLAPQPGDLRVGIDEQGVVTLARGNGSTWVDASPADAATVLPSVSKPASGIWNAEFCLPDSLLGGWNHRLTFAIGLHTLVTDRVWPGDTAVNDPDSWTPADLGPPLPLPNQPPLASAAAPAMAGGGEVVTLDGSASTDPDGDVLTFAWTQSSGSGVQLSSPAASVTRFTAPVVSVPTVLGFTLTVSDGAFSSSANVSVTIVPGTVPQPPAPTGVAGVDPDTSEATVILVWIGQPGERVIVQTGTTLGQWEDLYETIVGDSLRVRVQHQPSEPSPSRFYRLRAADTDAVVDPGHAVRFDGTDGVVTVPHDPVFNSYPMTASAYTLTTSSDATARGIMEKYVGGAFNGWLMFTYEGRLRAWYFRDGSNYIWNPDGDGLGIDGGPINDGFWHHCAFTVGPDGGSLYVDGSLRASLPWTGTPGAATTTLPLRFGKYDATGFIGDIEEAAFWNTTLTAPELAEAYRLSPVAGAPGLVSIWRFDEATGSIAGSSTAHDYNGALSGAVQWVPSSAPIYRR